jgi:kinesin family protein C1
LLLVENELSAEQSKAADLHSFQNGLQCELVAAKSQELETRRAYLLASDEIDALKKQHARAMEDVTATLTSRDRELKELKEDLARVQEELAKEREGRVERQKLQNEVVLLEAQVAALKQRGYTLQGEAEGLAADKMSLKEELEILRKLVAQRDEELRDAEMIRRKLHNQVQELKGAGLILGVVSALIILAQAISECSAEYGRLCV